MIRRLGLLALALVVALVGAGSLLSYANGSAARATTGQRTVAVLVVSKDVVAGTAGSELAASVGSRMLPVDVVPVGALNALTAVSDQVAGQDLHIGQVLLQSAFVSRALAGSLVIPTGKLAMTVQLQDPQRVGGYVLPGSRVAVFDTFSAGANATGVTTRMLLPRVQVLAVGNRALSTLGGTPGAPGSRPGVAATGTDPTALVTLSVDTGEALKIIQAAQTGKLYFALLSDTSRPGDAGQSIDSETLFN